jgi:hypothetical protein
LHKFCFKITFFDFFFPQKNSPNSKENSIKEITILQAAKNEKQLSSWLGIKT